MVKYILALFMTIVFIEFDAQNVAFQLFSVKNKKTTFDKILKASSKADIILFGEYHNDPIAHWLQYKLAAAMLHKHTTNVVMGAEMIESDNQTELTSYLKGEITQKAMDTLVRLWPNYHTDYKPLVDLSKLYSIPFIATNIPRQYAKLVFKCGFECLDTLSEIEKSWIAPLPILFDPELPGYKAMMAMMTSANHTSLNFPKAQAIKDATMAHFIMKNWSPGKKFIHFNGAYHSNNFEGIYWYLKKMNPQLNILTISTVSQKQVIKLDNEHKSIANFIVCVDEDMTKTH